MQPWLRRVPSIVGVLLFGGALFQCMAMPRGMGTGCDVYRVRGRVLDDATGAPIAGVWVTIRSDAAAAGSMQAQRGEVLELVRSAQAIEQARSERGRSRARDPVFVAHAAFDAARSGPDGTFELEMLVGYCHGEGGLFSRGDEARDPPRYRSLWVVTSQGLVAAAELPGAGWAPASPVPKELGEPKATLVLGDVRLPERL